MGWTWEVTVWQDIGQGYKDYQQYAGQSLWEAIKYMRDAKKNGIGCIRLTWRP